MPLLTRFLRGGLECSKASNSPVYFRKCVYCLRVRESFRNVGERSEIQRLG